ncbi:SDR family oxidoreductase [Trinickia mobilis]|uniref:SDR family oxidoreductase n=1 Tax=Trinickia mobilis TaxID=2816356 RepID=UPI001F5C9B4D|nr:SDR family oxidoreductase [Trinickia mobilis]
MTPGTLGAAGVGTAREADDKAETAYMVPGLERPEEAAQALFYLASPLSSYTTGSHIDVSGGVARHV